MFGRSGAGKGTRTPDPIITNDVLYQLSYTGTSSVDPLGPLGVRFSTSALLGKDLF